MTEEYLGSEVTKYTLNNGKEIILDIREFDELIKENNYINSLKNEIECLESDIEYLELELDKFIED